MVTNCCFVWNSASYGGGILVSGSKLVVDCTIVNNGGVGLNFSVPGNVADAPRFVDAAAGNFNLAGSSPCIDKGIFRSWMTMQAVVAPWLTWRNEYATESSQVSFSH